MELQLVLLPSPLLRHSSFLCILFLGGNRGQRQQGVGLIQ